MNEPEDLISVAPAAQFKVIWVDSGRAPKVKPDPRYPDGIDVNMTLPGQIGCRAALGYPAKRIGRYHIRCLMCDLRVAVTTAGRPDDPRSVTMPCEIVAGDPRKAPALN